MAFGIVLYDTDRTIVAIDDAAALAFAQPAAALIGRRIWDFIPRPDRDALREAVAEYERTGQASGRYVFHLDDGRQQPFLYSARANDPLPGLYTMLLAPLEDEVDVTQLAPRYQEGRVYMGAELSLEERQVMADELGRRLAERRS
jgi:PAS domain-containing protein